MSLGAFIGRRGTAERSRRGKAAAMSSEKDRDYELLEMAIEEAYESVKQGHGYPFGAVIPR